MCWPVGGCAIHWTVTLCGITLALDSTRCHPRSPSAAHTKHPYQHTSTMHRLVVALLMMATIMVIHAQQLDPERPQCSNDPCFVQANVDAACCILDNPDIVKLAGDAQADMATTGIALRQYVQTVCSPNCRTSIFGEYRQCLQSAPIDQSLIEDYIPASLCNLQCLIEEGLDFTDLTNCEQYLSISDECMESVMRVEGLVGNAVSMLASNCTASEEDGQDVAAAPAPLVEALDGPIAIPPSNKTQAPAGVPSSSSSSSTTASNDARAVAAPVSALVGAAVLACMLL